MALGRKMSLGWMFEEHGIELMLQYIEWHLQSQRRNFIDF